jgi:hypothetical protein
MDDPLSGEHKSDEVPAAKQPVTASLPERHHQSSSSS